MEPGEGNDDRGAKPLSRSLPQLVAVFAASLQGTSDIFAGKSQVLSVHREERALLQDFRWGPLNAHQSFGDGTVGE